MLENIKKIDKKLLIMVGVLFSVILIIVIAFIAMSLSTGGTLSFEKIENKLETAAKNYYKDNDSSLPKEIGETTEIESSTLVSGGYISDLSEYTEENVVCSGKVLVGKIEDGYDYVASLDCGDEYKTEFLYEKLIKDVTTSGNGLYKMEDVVKLGSSSDLGIDEDDYDLSSNELMSGYIYRGENVKNYIELNGTKFQIVKIDGNNDFTVTIVKTKLKGAYDDRYNSDIEKDYGINDYEMSRAHEIIGEAYASLDKSSILKSKITRKNICIGARSEDETSTDGSVECSKVMKNQSYSLIPAFDIMNASLSENCSTTIDKECGNYNYLISNNSHKNYWTATPSLENSYEAYRIMNGLASYRANYTTIYKYVYYLSNRLIYVSGTGTESDPYIVK